MKFEASESKDKNDKDNTVEQVESKLFAAAYEKNWLSPAQGKGSAPTADINYLPGLTLIGADMQPGSASVQPAFANPKNQHMDQRANKALDKLGNSFVDPAKVVASETGAIVADRIVDSILNGTSGLDSSFPGSVQDLGTGNGKITSNGFLNILNRRGSRSGSTLDSGLLPEDITSSPDMPGFGTADRLQNPRGVNVPQRRGLDPRSANGGTSTSSTSGGGSPGWNRPDQAPAPATPFGEGSFMDFLANKAKETKDSGAISNKVTAINDAVPVRSPSESKGGGEEKSAKLPVSDAVEAIDKATSDEAPEATPSEAPIQTDAPKSTGDVIYALTHPDDDRPHLTQQEMQLSIAQSIQAVRQSLTNPIAGSTRNQAKNDSFGNSRSMAHVSNPNPTREDDHSAPGGQVKGPITGIRGGDPFQS